MLNTYRLFITFVVYFMTVRINSLITIEASGKVEGFKHRQYAETPTAVKKNKNGISQHLKPAFGTNDISRRINDYQSQKSAN